MIEYFEEVDAAYRGRPTCGCMNQQTQMMPDVLPCQKMPVDQPQPMMPDTSCNACVLDKIGLAQAYIPYQTTLNIMGEARSLACGTIFSDLVSPYRKGTGLVPDSMCTRKEEL